MDKLNRPDWDVVFLAMAFLIAQRSTDCETKHGSVLVDKHKKIIGLGFNGFPRGAKDFELPTTRPEKYAFMIHSEANCLDNCLGIEEPSTCTLYITGDACQECSKRIIQAGIGKVITGNVSSNCMQINEKYQADLKKIQSMGKTRFIKIKSEKLNHYKTNINELLQQTFKYLDERWVA